MKKYIIIAGCPAVGKKTIAAELSAMMGIPFLEYSSFLLEAGAARRANGEIIIDEKRANEAFDSLSGKHIISGTYVPRLIDPAEVISAVVVRCSPFVLYCRYMVRNYDLLKIRENLTAEFVDTCLAETVEFLGRENVMQIDSTFETSRSAAGRIYNALKSGSFLFDEVDWLSYINDCGQLKKLML
ncbi:MAG: AAA family ATPase [Nitrososphaeria archaeon]